MNIVRNVLAVLAGFVVGSGLNMTLVMIGPMLIAPPAGVDVSNAESLVAGIHLFEPKHFIVPLVAHALGTFAGALVAYLVAATAKARFAWAIGLLFFCGGVAASFMIPAPGWFVALDLVVAYLPMAWLAVWLGGRLGPVAAALDAAA